MTSRRTYNNIPRRNGMNPSVLTVAQFPFYAPYFSRFSNLRNYSQIPRKKASTFALSGFFISNRVLTTFCCGKTMGLGSLESDPFALHALYSPDCPYFNLIIQRPSFNPNLLHMRQLWVQLLSLM